MKKFFALTLAVVMVLAVASSAMAAFTWNKGTGTTADSFANRYKIEVVKLANETGIIGTNKLIEAPGATAVNNASVYFYIRLTVTGASASPTDVGATDNRDDVQKRAQASVSFTALKNASNASMTDIDGASIAHLTNGVYYYDVKVGEWKLITDTIGNSDFSNAAIEGRVLDTATAKVYAKVSSKRDLKTFFNSDFSNGYWVKADGSTVTFQDKDGATPDKQVTFTRDGNGKVTAVNYASGTDINWSDGLYTFLGFRASDVTAGNIYLSDDNIRAAFGFDYKGESSITWNANPTAIILDPAIGVGIPKTGDNASVIGFAMVMIAVVGAAVAVKKVRA